jgi:hypothetical protein
VAEYIERKAAIDACFNGWNNNAHDCAENIRSIPAADVRPVARGKWISGDYRDVTAVCSNCGHLRLGNGAEWATKLAFFCEKCGADMREKS